jgi:Flp pilus assembly pilin Flp
MSIADLYTYLRARFVREEGQTMAEYGVVLAVITLVVIGAFTALSGGIDGAIRNVAKVVSG